MRITLIYPSVGRKENTAYVRAWQMEPLSMAVLGGLTPRDLEVRFYDDRMEPIPFDEPTDLAAISVETFTALRAYKIARQFRARGIPVVLGGYHVTLIPEEAALEADAIVIGDAEPVWQRLLDDARHGRLEPVYQGRAPRPLAGLRPRRELFRGKDYQRIALVESTRGCHFRCDFCSITAFHRASQNRRPPREVAAEMEACGHRWFFIVDDNLAAHPDWARELCCELAPLHVRWVGQIGLDAARDGRLLELMVASGCRGVLVGMESLDPANLQAMGKSWNLAAESYARSLGRLRKHGLAVYGTFLFGYDHDDADTIQRSVDFARQQKLFLAAFNHLVPFPGTPLYRRLERQGRLLTSEWWLDAEGRVGDVVFRPRKMSPEELAWRCLQARRQFYSWRSIFGRMGDLKVNASSLPTLATFLALNLGSRGDIDLRQGLQLGAGRWERESLHESVPV
jgi:radical SAM superfamily enzyme YgiQ (UPF0313 family)